MNWRVQLIRSRSAALVRGSFLGVMLLLVSLLPVGAAPDPISLQDARQQLTATQQAIAAASERRLRELREEVLTLQTSLQGESSRLEPELAHVKERVAALGATSSQAKEPAEVATERATLKRQETELEGELRLANALALEADQTLSRISSRAREQFRERLGDRFQSPLRGAFWAELRAAAPEDLQRARASMSLIQELLRRSSPLVWLAVLVTMTLVLVIRSRLARRLRSMAAMRSLPAVGASSRVLLDCAAAALVAATIVLAVNSDGGREAPISSLLSGMVIIIAFGAYIYALGTALLYRGGHSGPQAPLLPNALSVHLRGFGLQFALTISLISLVEELAAAIDTSPSLSVAIAGLLHLILAVVLARGLRCAGRASSSTWLTFCLGIGWVAVAASVLSVFVGYVALGGFIVGQFAWALIVVCTAYLLIRVVDDTLVALTSRHAAFSEIGRHRRAAVLAAALLKFAIAGVAVLVLLAPYGAGAVDLLQQLHRVRQGISIGAVQLRPAAMIRAFVILALGIACVRMIRTWFQRRYLPLTPLDVGMRQSVTALIGYAGYAVIAATTLSALGVGLQQIAWVASALALGVGFGLQAIVQNFVSGLILLAERPVRVGDWVALGGFEGDVRRINARATLIQQLDRSMVIVPNSEFITKVVRNITYDDPLGRVQLKLPLPIDTDVERVRMELVRAFKAHADILDEPEPNVTLEVMEGGYVLFNAIGFVSSPRAAFRVRSAVLFDVLGSLKKAGVTVTAPYSMAVSPVSGQSDAARSLHQ